MTVPIPEEARALAREALAQAAADTLDVVVMADATVRAAAPLIIAAYLDGIGREFWRDSHISKVCRERASCVAWGGTVNMRDYETRMRQRAAGRRLLTDEAEAAAADVAVPMPEHASVISAYAKECVMAALPLAVADHLQALLDDAFPDEDSDYHYGCERLLDLVRDGIPALRGEGQTHD